MKTLSLIVLAIVTVSLPLQADEYVDGYYTKNGTYVPGHYRSDPNSTKADNWSSQGNENPYTGKKGHKKY